MNKPIVRYRVLVTLVTIAVSTGLIVGNHHLPAAYQLFAWGAAIGLLSTFGYIVATWLFDLPLLALIFIIPFIDMAVRYSFGFGLGSPRQNYYWLGEGLGLVTMLTISMALPLRTARSRPPQRRTMPPLEESSPHKLILPRTPEPRPDQRRPD